MARPVLLALLALLLALPASAAAAPKRGQDIRKVEAITTSAGALVRVTQRALPDLVRPRCPRPRLRGQLQRPRGSVVSSGTSQIAPSGGSVISAENAWLCHGIGSASMPP